MRWKRKNSLGRFMLRETIELDGDVERVFALWSRYEDFPRFMRNVRRIKRIDERRVLWDVDISGRQVVWEARIVEVDPDKLVRWEASWDTEHIGEARFESIKEARTRLTIDIEFRPRKAIEQLGSRLGIVDQHVWQDLERFRDIIESCRLEEQQP